LIGRKETVGMKTRRKPELGTAVALSIEAGAAAAGVGRDTLRAAIRAGDVHVVQLGRRRLIRLQELDRWLQTRERAAGK
jgi:excisionase family DNA binding protein